MKHLDNNTWPLGLSWTKGGYPIAWPNPDGTIYHTYIHSGPFLFLQFDLRWFFDDNRMLEIYVGFKPTPDYDPKFDPSILLPFFERLKRRFKLNNLNAALRLPHY